MNTDRRIDHKVRPPRGVIACLAAGFEIVGRNLPLVALPVSLDVFLWLGPRFSVRPVVGALVDALRARALADPSAGSQLAHTAKLLEEFGVQFNLLSVAGGMPLLQMPSLLVRRTPGVTSPLGDHRVFSVSSILALIPWWAGLAFFGLIVGFVYLNEIARQVEVLGGSFTGRGAGAAPSRDGSPDESWREGPWKLLRFVVFAVALLVIGSALVPLWLLIVAVGTVIAQPLGILFWIGGAGLFGYVVLHLVFVVPGLLLGERSLFQAVGESVLLSHLNVWSVFGLILITVVIHEGLGYAWSLPTNDSWALLVGIVGNAFVATGLTSAAFVFYGDRLRVARELSILTE